MRFLWGLWVGSSATILTDFSPAAAILDSVQKSLGTISLFVTSAGSQPLFDGIVVNAEAIRDHVAGVERFPSERIRVIPNGVELPCSTKSQKFIRTTPLSLLEW